MRSWGHSLIVFDLTTFNCYPKAASEDGRSEGRRKTAIPLDKWNGRFGPTYAESKRSLQVNTFDEYTIIHMLQNVSRHMRRLLLS